MPVKKKRMNRCIEVTDFSKLYVAATVILPLHLLLAGHCAAALLHQDAFYFVFSSIIINTA